MGLYNSTVFTGNQKRMTDVDRKTQRLSGLAGVVEYKQCWKNRVTITLFYVSDEKLATLLKEDGASRFRKVCCIRELPRWCPARGQNSKPKLVLNPCPGRVKNEMVPQSISLKIKTKKQKQNSFSGPQRIHLCMWFVYNTYRNLSTMPCMQRMLVSLFESQVTKC